MVIKTRTTAPGNDTINPTSGGKSMGTHDADMLADLTRIQTELDLSKQTLLRKSILQQNLEKKLQTTQQNLSKASLEISNFKAGTVGTTMGDLPYNIAGYTVGDTTTGTVTAASTARKYSRSIFSQPSSTKNSDVRVQLEEEGKIGTVELTTDPSSFWPWWQEFKDHSTRLYWDKPYVLCSIPATTKHNGMHVHLLRHFYMLTIDDVVAHMEDLLLRLEDNPTDAELKFQYK